MHHVTNFDRRMLVWVKRYPSIAEVPEKITYVLYHLFSLHLCITEEITTSSFL